MAAGMLWVLDASINIAMEPFRAFVADQLPPTQRPTGYSMQSFFIGVGAVVASMLPWMLDARRREQRGEPRIILFPTRVRYSFDIGAVVLLGAILWTILTTREYPPASCMDSPTPRRWPKASSPAVPIGPRCAVWPGPWSAAGRGARVAVRAGPHVVRARRRARGVGRAAARSTAALRGASVVSTLIRDIDNMPQRMRELVPVQFFSWLALFAMWTIRLPP